MKRWVIVDDCGVDIFTEVLPAETRDQAIEQAESEWDRLTAHDKRRRCAFFVGLAEVEEDGDFAIASIVDCYYIKG